MSRPSLETLRWCVRRVIQDRHSDVRILDELSVLRDIDSDRFYLPIEIDRVRESLRLYFDFGEEFLSRASWDKPWMVERIIDSIDNFVARIRDDRRAAEERQSRFPEWSPYPMAGRG